MKQGRQQFLLFIMMGLIAAGLMIFSLHTNPLNAAGSISRIELVRYTLNSCAANTFHGQYGLIAYDDAGNVVNNTTSVNVTGIFTTGAGVFETAAYPHNNTENYTFTVYTTSTNLSSGTAYFYLTDNPSIQTATYVLDCSGPNMYVLVASGGSDDRLNWSHGDLLNVIYSRWDKVGNPEIWVYTLNAASEGVLNGIFKYDDFKSYLGKPPQQNTRIGKVSQSTLYALTTGEFQINIGPDDEGKTYSIILDKIPPTHLYYPYSESR